MPVLHNNETDAYTLTVGTHPSSTTFAEVYAFGATITQWSVGGAERLFLSSKAILNGTKAIRGGIPLVFPHFGKPSDSPLPQHGFARISRWRYEGVICNNAVQVSIAFSLGATDLPTSLKSAWPYAFRLLYTITLTTNTLKTEFNVQNIDAKPFPFTALLHTYFGCDDVTSVEVQGFDGLNYLNTVGNASSNLTETRAKAVIDSQEVDRVYYNAPSAITISGLGRGNGTIVLVKSSTFPDTVLWNPWVEKSKGMADFEENGHLRMVCVEVGHVAEPVILEPGSSWIASQVMIAV